MWDLCRDAFMGVWVVVLLDWDRLCVCTKCS
jgi:hypothetical protein